MANAPIHISAMTKGDYDRFVEERGRSPLQHPRAVKSQSRAAHTIALRSSNSSKLEAAVIAGRRG